MKTKIIIFTIATILLFSCDDRPYHQMNKMINDFYVFKKGSWWVYEDENTHKTDCLYIADAKYGYRKMGINFFYDEYIINYSSKDSAFYGTLDYLAGPDNCASLQGDIFYNKIEMSLFFGFIWGNHENIVKDTLNGIAREHAKIVKTADSTLYGKEILVFFNNDTISGTQVIEIWRERDIGVTKLRIKNDTCSYNLKLIKSSTKQQ